MQFTPLSFNEEEVQELKQQKEMKEAYTDNLKAGLRQLIAKDVAAKKLRKRQQLKNGSTEAKAGESGPKSGMDLINDNIVQTNIIVSEKSDVPNTAVNIKAEVPGKANSEQTFEEELPSLSPMKQAQNILKEIEPFTSGTETAYASNRLASNK